MVLLCFERPQNRNNPVLSSPSGEMNMLAITGRKVSSSAHTADLSQRAYFKGAESISLPWYEVKAVKNEIEEDVFKMVLHRSFEEKGEERHSNACLMFCDYLKTKPKTNKQTKPKRFQSPHQILVVEYCNHQNR